MVFFTCNACGESIKKVQVEKHRSICRSCKCLSCIDCGKDFWGDDYKNHLKCISEDQKYGGKGFEAKANKGEVKQQQWIQKIHEAMKKPGLSLKLKDILNQMSTYENIPRKKAKFQNWMKNSLKIHDSVTQEKVWEIFSEAHSNVNTNSHAKHPEEVVKQCKENDSALEENKLTIENGEKKKSKRERKEERQKNKKKEKKELNAENEEADVRRKKGKKSSMEIEEIADVEPEETPGNDGAEKKKKKKKNMKESKEDLEVNEKGHDLEITEPEKIKRNLKKRKHSTCEGESNSKQKKIEKTEFEETEDATEITVQGKFNWKGTIKAVLKKAPDNEIALKKLRKKVLAQYYTVAREHHKSEEEILAIFNKKIHCNPKFKVLKEKVKLLT